MVKEPLLSSRDHVIPKVTNLYLQVNVPEPLVSLYRAEDENPIVTGLNGPVLLILATILFTVLSMVGVVGAIAIGFLHDQKIIKVTPPNPDASYE